MSDLAPEERARRVKAALAEAGYPNDKPFVYEEPDGSRIVRITGDAPPETRWRAWALAGEPDLICWQCYIGGVVWPDCAHDPLTSPWPEVVR